MEEKEWSAPADGFAAPADPAGGAAPPAAFDLAEEKAPGPASPQPASDLAEQEADRAAAPRRDPAEEIFSDPAGMPGPAGPAAGPAPGRPGAYPAEGPAAAPAARPAPAMPPAGTLAAAALDPSLTPEQQALLLTVQTAAQAAADAARADARGEALLASQLAAIHTMDPSIRTVGDLRRMAEFGEFDQYVRAGLGLDDAFRLACFGRLQAGAEARARQAAVNAARSKSHLIPPAIAAAGPAGADIPASELDCWRSAFPEESDDALRARYNRVLGGAGW